MAHHIVSPLTGGVVIAATATSGSSAIVMPTIANAIMVSNTSATLYVTVKAGTGAQTAVIGTGDVSIPPMGQVMLGANPSINTVAAVASGAGPTDVTFLPCVVTG